MDQSFELASNTPITGDALQAVDSRKFGGALYNHYVRQDPTAAPAAVLSSLAAVDTLEEQVAALEDRVPQLFTLARLFRASLRRPQFTQVPGHGTVTEVGIADGDLGVQSNLLVEGTLLVAGDLSVGGQVVIGDRGIIIVTGSLHSSAIAGTGQISVGEDIRTMFAELEGADFSLDVSGELDAFLLIQNDRTARAGHFSVGLHAVYPRPDAAQEVFLPSVIADGKPDWTAIARAAQSAEDIFLDTYRTPAAAPGTAVQQL